MRIAAKTLSSKPLEFIPKSHLEDESLKAENPEIKDRPLVFVHGLLTREDLLNIRSLMRTESRKSDSATEEIVTNMGDVMEYIFKKKVYEVKNVLLQDGEKVEEFESVKGIDKDRLWETRGIDLEIMECVKHIQELSTFTKEESKN